MCISLEEKIKSYIKYLKDEIYKINSKLIVYHNLYEKQEKLIIHIYDSENLQDLTYLHLTESYLKEIILLYGVKDIIIPKFTGQYSIVMFYSFFNEQNTINFLKSLNKINDFNI